jgi:hypothetical protein
MFHICTNISAVYQKIKFVFFKLRLVSDLSHGKYNNQYFFDDIGWCPILAQPWVRSDTSGFKKNNGSPDGKTNGLGFANRGPKIHTNIFSAKIQKNTYNYF